jgi:MFS family permease
MSFLLVIVGLYIRLKVSETPAFEQAQANRQEAKAPVIEAFRQYPGTILRLLVIWCAPTACFYVINVFSLSYITKNLGLSSQTAFLCLMVANLIAVLTMVMGGALSDRLGRKPTMLIASILTLVIALSYFPLLDTKNWYVIFLAMAAFVGALQIQSGVQPAFFAEPFPTRVRYSGSAAAYTGSNLLVGGPTPFIAAWLFQHSGGQTWVITAFCVVIILFSLVAIIASPETRHVDIKR